MLSHVLLFIFCLKLILVLGLDNHEEKGEPLALWSRSVWEQEATKYPHAWPNNFYSTSCTTEHLPCQYGNQYITYDPNNYTIAEYNPLVGPEVVVASYPSSGSTWLRKLYKFFTNQTTLTTYANPEKISNKLKDYANADEVKLKTEPIYLKTHFPANKQSMKWTNPFEWPAANDLSHLSYSKLIIVGRSPVATASSSHRRWGMYHNPNTDI